MYKADEPSIGPGDSESLIKGSEGLYKGEYMSPLCYKIYVIKIFIRKMVIFCNLGNHSRPMTHCTFIGQLNLSHLYQLPPMISGFKCGWGASCREV